MVLAVDLPLVSICLVSNFCRSECETSAKNCGRFAKQKLVISSLCHSAASVRNVPRKPVISRSESLKGFRNCQQVFLCNQELLIHTWSSSILLFHNTRDEMEEASSCVYYQGKSFLSLHVALCPLLLHQQLPSAKCNGNVHVEVTEDELLKGSN